jgi:hypothetical protein
MDYVWAALPCVLAAGDEVADELARVGAAQLVAPHDAAGTAAALESLLDAPDRLQAARDACRAAAASYRWAALLEPLVDQVETAVRGASSPRRTLSVARDAASYYVRRAVDRCLTALP